MPRFIQFSEFSGFRANIDDTGEITVEGEEFSMAIAPQKGSKSFRVKGIRFRHAGPTIPDADGAHALVLRQHHDTPYKVIGMIALNSDPLSYSRGPENNAYRRVFHTSPDRGATREIYIDFSDDDDVVDRDNPIVIKSLDGLGDPAGTSIHIVVEDV